MSQLTTIETPHQIAGPLMQARSIPADGNLARIHEILHLLRAPKDGDFAVTPTDMRLLEQTPGSPLRAAVGMSLVLGGTSAIYIEVIRPLDTLATDIPHVMERIARTARAHHALQNLIAPVASHAPNPPSEFPCLRLELCTDRNTEGTTSICIHIRDANTVHMTFSMLLTDNAIQFGYRSNGALQRRYKGISGVLEILSQDLSSMASHVTPLVHTVLEQQQALLQC